MPIRLLWKPVKSAALWATGGVGAGWVVPLALKNAGLIYSSSLMTTTFCGGAIVVLLPLGLARGSIASVQELSEHHGKQAIQQAVDLSGGKVLTSESVHRVLEQLTGGNSYQGQMLRVLASPFLPSTAQMMARLQESLDDKSLQKTDGQVLAAAAGGFVEGFLQDKKDTITMLGSLGYLACLGVGFGIDYTWRRAAEKTQAIADKGKETAQQIHEKLQNAKDTLDKGYDFARMENKVKEAFDQAMESLKSESNQQAMKEIMDDAIQLFKQVQAHCADDQMVLDMRQRLEQVLRQVNERMNEKDARELHEKLTQSAKDYEKKFQEQTQKLELQDQMEKTKEWVQSTKMGGKLQQKWKDVFGQDDKK